MHGRASNISVYVVVLYDLLPQEWMLQYNHHFNSSFSAVSTVPLAVHCCEYTKPTLYSKVHFFSPSSVNIYIHCSLVASILCFHKEERERDYFGIQLVSIGCKLVGDFVDNG